MSSNAKNLATNVLHADMRQRCDVVGNLRSVKSRCHDFDALILLPFAGVLSLTFTQFLFLALNISLFSKWSDRSFPSPRTAPGTHHELKSVYKHACDHGDTLMFDDLDILQTHIRLQRSSMNPLMHLSHYALPQPSLIDLAKPVTCTPPLRFMGATNITFTV